MSARHHLMGPVLTLLIAAAAGTATVHASSVDQLETSAATSKDPIQQIPHTLKALDAAKAGEYGKLRTEDPQRLDAADRDIQALTQGDRDLTTLNEQERTRLFSAQETIMAIVSGLKGSQLVCTYGQNVGTRFRTKHCVTRDMAEAQRRASKDAAHSMQNTMCYSNGGSGDDPVPRCIR